MGGHGGLNILPQKRWNVYNFDNREKVRKDEEAAAKEEQIKREQSRKRDTEFRLEQLRQARGLASASASSSREAPSTTATAVSDSVESESKVEPELEPKSKHMNLFEGIRIFDPIEVKNKHQGELGDENRKGFKRMKKEAEAPKVVLPEDEKYRLGYGLAGKGVKLPWYMEKRPNGDSNGDDDVNDDGNSERGSRSSGKKSLEELREERLKRERTEKERQRALLLQKGGRRGLAQSDREFSRRYGVPIMDDVGFVNGEDNQTIGR